MERYILKFSEYMDLLCRGLETCHISLLSYVNNQQYFNFRNEVNGFWEWSSDQRFYRILNNVFRRNCGGAKGRVLDLLLQRMEVEYVRVYQKIEIN